MLWGHDGGCLQNDMLLSDKTGKAEEAAWKNASYREMWAGHA